MGTPSSMEAFGLMREELKREREIRSDLLAALEALVDRFTGHSQDDDDALAAALAAIAKALGTP